MLTFIILWTIIINVLRGVAQMGARVVWDHEVAGSIPVTPTIKNKYHAGIVYRLILQPSKLERWVRFPLPAPFNTLSVFSSAG